MAGITHHKVATLADDPSAEVGKDEWNEAHDLDDITSLPTAETDTAKVLAPDGAGGVEFRAETGGGGGGAPTTADYLVGTANAGLSNEIAVGTTPGGELGGTWASPTVDATHSGSTHAATQSAAEATAASALSGHVAAGDPHTGYRLESADHTHATTGAQGGTVDHGALTGLSDDDHPQYATNAEFDDHSARHDAGGADALAIDAAQATGSLRTITTSSAQAIGTAAAGAGTAAASSNHVHATGAGTPSTQAIGDAAATGTGPAASMTDHKHAMPAFGTGPAAVGTQANGSSANIARIDHVHATGAGTPSTQAFGDAASTGSGPAAAMTDHKHAMPANPVVVGGWSAIVKQSDETVTNSSTLQDDDELLFAVLASELWRFEVEIGYSATANGDFKCDLSISTGAAQWTIRYLGSDTTTNAVLVSTGIRDATSATTTDIAAGGGSASVWRSLLIEGFVRPDNNGNIVFRFAQNSAQVGESAIVKAGSVLRYRRMVA